MDYVGVTDRIGNDPMSDQNFLLRSTIIDLETMRTPYEPASRGYMALTTAISIGKCKLFMTWAILAHQQNLN